MNKISYFRKLLLVAFLLLSSLVALELSVGFELLSTLLGTEWQKNFFIIILIILFIIILYAFYSIDRIIARKNSAEARVVKERDTALQYFEIAGTILVIINKAQVIERINNKGCEVLGYEKHELIGNYWYEFCPEQKNIEKTKSVFNDLMRGNIEETRYFENKILSKTGEEKLIGWHTILLKDFNGVTTGTLSSGENITERRRVEEELQAAKVNAESANLSMKTILDVIRENEEKLRIITSTASDAILMVDEKGMMHFYNKAAVNMFGYKEAEAYQKQICHLLDPEKGMKAFRKSFTEIMENQSCQIKGDPIALVGKKKNGSLFPVETTLSSVVLNQKKYAVCVLRDVTIRKQYEEEIQRQKNILEAVFQAFPDTMFLVDMNNDIFMSNPGFTSMFGYSMDDILGTSLKRLYSDKNGEGLLADFTARFVSGKAFVQEYRRQDQTCFMGETLVARVTHNPGKEENYLIVIRDITERLANEKTLEEAKLKAETASRAKGEFLANMSHEIRTPMNAILGFSDLLYGNTHDSVNREYISAIQYSGKTLLGLINDILDLSKIESGIVNISSTPINLKVFLGEISTIFSKKINEKGVTLQFDIIDTFPKWILIDENRWRQILINLLANAVKFTPSGYIRVSANCREKTENTYDIDIHVADTGIGIPEDQLDKIFDAFEQVEGQDYMEYGGTGLGLAITKKLVHILGGTVTVKSSLNQGSIFSIHFFDIPAPVGLYEKEYTGSKEEDEQIQFERTNVLIVDDTETNRYLLKSYLSGYNFDIKEAENGNQVLQMVNDHRPDLILMDVKMPGMEGDKVTKLIRQNELNKDIVIIAVTAFVMTGTQARYAQIFDGVLKKPLSKKDIIRELKKNLPYRSKKCPASETETHDAHSSEKKGLANDIRELSVLIEMLDGNFRRKWENIKETMTINDIEAFAEQIKNLGNKHNYQPLTRWGATLLTLVSAFDMEALETALEDYISLVETIKHSR